MAKKIQLLISLTLYAIISVVLLVSSFMELSLALNMSMITVRIQLFWYSLFYQLWNFDLFEGIRVRNYMNLQLLGIHISNFSCWNFCFHSMQKWISYFNSRKQECLPINAHSRSSVHKVSHALIMLKTHDS